MESSSPSSNSAAVLIGGRASRKHQHRQQHNQSTMVDASNNVFIQHQRQNPQKGARNRQKTSSRPSLNSSDLDAYSLASASGGGNNYNASKSGSRNQKALSLNHLLNFSFPERQSHSPSKRSSSYHPTFNKERFVNANFRFVMKPDFVDKDYLANPDLIVKWEQVSQMVIPTSNETTCPICLSPPTAARVAKCGHLFCMPCIQHYVALSDHSWRKCPICFESIYAAALKPVLFLPTTAMNMACSPYDPSAAASSSTTVASSLGPSTPRMVEFTLVRRDPTSTIALPIISYRKWKSLIPSVDLTSALAFSKFLTATPEYLRNLIENDISVLAATLAEIESSGESSYESSFIEMCLDLLKTDLAVMDEQKQQQSTQKSKKNGSGAGGHTSDKQAVVLPAADDSNSFYFYQSADGQHIYLHPLDIKVLKHEFGSYDNFPSHIKLPVISIRESTVNGDLRKRCKYLSHLPLSCDVSFVEVDMSDIVSAPTLNAFSNELSERMEKLLRLEQDRDAERARQASRKAASSPPPSLRSPFGSSLKDISGGSMDQHQAYDYEDFGPPLSALSVSPDNYPPLSASASTPPINKSFATMAMTSASSSWSRSGYAGPSRTSWVASAQTASSTGIVEEEISAAWKLEIPDNVLASAVVASSPVTSAHSSNPLSPTTTPGSGKKKKPQKIVLLGNGGSRGALFNHS